MAKNETVRIRPGILKSDEDAFIALQAMQAYNPANVSFSKSTLTGSLADMQAAQQAEVNAQNALDAARDARPSKPSGIFTTPCWAPRRRSLPSTGMIQIRRRLWA